MKSKVTNVRSRPWTLDIGLWTLLAAVSLFAAEIDVSKLPAASAQPVDFARDIKPIFETACMKCHGEEKPKGRFSLSTREAALKGGNEGIDIIPGDSAKSPLIHYVARLVPDMEMPPDGKGAPLTSQEISILRAWIDQGAAWPPIDREAEYAQYTPKFSVTPAVRYVTVSGNARKFQEHQWVRRGFSGGVSDFRVAQKRPDGFFVVAEGRALTDDYKVTLDLRKEDAGFARAGFEQFRRYYDDHGPAYRFRPSGFSSFAPNIFSLDRETHLDITTAFVEFGLTLPDWPRAVLGYELHSRHGNESTGQWGPVAQLPTADPVHIYPARQHVNEDVHVLRLDVSHEIAGARVENNLRAEFLDLQTERANVIDFPAGAAFPAAFAVMRETHDQVQFANTLHGEKAIRDWLLVSAGYLFSQFDADASLRQTSVDGAGRPAPNTFWRANDIVLEESAHVLNANALLGPWEHLTVSLGVLNEWSEQSGFGRPNYAEGDPNDPTVGVEDEFGMVESDTDRVLFEENLALRYTMIPATVLFAEGRWKQERIGMDEAHGGGHHAFLRDTDVRTDWQDYRAGFDVSPLHWASWHGGYKHRLRKSDFDDVRDERPPGTPGDGYPAFIRSRESETDVIETRVALRPAHWLKATLSYQLAFTDYDTTTDPSRTIGSATPGGHIFAGEHDSATYSANLTVTPARRWYFSTTFSFQESRTWTEDHGNPSVAPYRGETFSVAANSTFAATTRTDLTAGYSFSRARFGQHQLPSGVPLGLDYDLHGVQFGISHRLHTNANVGIQYGFHRYEEPTAHGANDYTAHVIFGTLAFAWP
jgi:hypothetical protein